MFQTIKVQLNSRNFSMLQKFMRLSTSKTSQENSQTREKSQKSPKYASIILASLGSIYLYKNRVASCRETGKKPGDFLPHLKTFTAEEVSKHDSRKNQIWVTFREGVYDITDFVQKHPGGSGKILMAAGGSIEPFWKIFANHKSPEIYSLLESMRIGNLDKKDVVQDEDKENDPYGNEPVRHESLKVNGKQPFCGETPGNLLGSNFYTPSEYFYVRNHLPVPEINLQDYELEIAIEDETKKTLTFEDLKKYPKYTVTSAIMCGGNRRSEMAEVKPLKGLSWEIGAIGNAKWTGVRLYDILKELGFKETHYGHVQFEGVDTDPSGIPYGASIPISKAMNPKCDVILAYEMNGNPLTRDHGFPIRVVVPGVVGARNVKWLARIIISKDESQSQFQQNDYKGFSPSTDWDNVDFKTSPAIQDLPITSAICSPQKNERVFVKNSSIPVKGYAYSGGGRKIIRVDVTADKGKTWHVARMVSDPEAEDGRSWGWTLWELNIPVDSQNPDTEIWAKAVDSSYNTQPESFQNIWNLRGLLGNAYHRVSVTLIEK